MPRTARKVECDEAMRQELARLSRSQKDEARRVRRARRVLGCVEGRRIKDLAARIGEQQDVIIKWRDRFIESGLPGLLDKARPDKPVSCGDEWKRVVLAKLGEKPPHGMARWNGPTLAAELKTSPDAVQRFLQRHPVGQDEDGVRQHGS